MAKRKVPVKPAKPAAKPGKPAKPAKPRKPPGRIANREPVPPARPVLPGPGRPAQYASRAPYADRRPLHVPDLGGAAGLHLDSIREAMERATGRKVPNSDVVRFALWLAAIRLDGESVSGLARMVKVFHETYGGGQGG